MRRYDDSPQPAADDDAIEAAAADWLARRVRGLTPVEAAELARWRDADQRHAAVFADLEEVWRTLDQLDVVRLPDGRRVDHDLSTLPAKSVEPKFGARAKWGAAVLAAAAAVALVFTLPWERTAPPLHRIAATETGGFEKLALPDGSIIRLNTDSAVEIDFRPVERRVHITRGEANFEVATDSARPFVVRAGDVAVRAVGTAFNVRFRPEMIDVLVTEGSVRVDHATDGASLLTGSGSTPVLSAGQRVTIARRAPTAPPSVTVASVPPEDAARELAWQERRLEFTDTPLREVVAEFNRYNRHKLVIADARLNERRFGGSIRADNGEAFVRLLESRFGVKVDQRETETLLRVTE